MTRSGTFFYISLNLNILEIVIQQEYNKHNIEGKKVVKWSAIHLLTECIGYQMISQSDHEQHAVNGMFTICDKLLTVIADYSDQYYAIDSK